MSLSIPSPLAAVRTADLLPSVLKVQQLRTFLSPFLRFTASMICDRLFLCESMSTVYTATFVVFFFGLDYLITPCQFTGSS